MRIHAIVGTLVVLIAGTAANAGRVEGHGRFERIKGHPGMGYVELYETNLFLSAAGPNQVGPSRRLGTSCANAAGGCDSLTTHDGCYCVDGIASGTYSLLANQPVFYVAPKVISGITVPLNGSVHLDFELGIDYSTFFKDDWTAQAGNVWYQTFVATGTAVRGVAFSFAGNVPTSISVALLEDNGDPDVRNWRHIVERTDGTVDDVTDNWVRFRSAEAPTVPGRHYAVRLSAYGAAIQPYKRNKDASSYINGQAYDSGGNPQSFDLNIVVFSDNDYTTVTLNKRTEGNGDLVEGNFAAKWGHTFVARGIGLAGVDLWAAGAQWKWDIDFGWKIYVAGPNGPVGEPIGFSKTTKAAYQSYGVGLHGVSYSRGEVPLTVGQSYFIEFSAVNPPPESPGFNPCVMSDDFYDEGMAFVWTGSAWQARPGTDLAMTIVEYLPLPPQIVCTPAAITKEGYFGGDASPIPFNVSNGGAGTLQYSVGENLSWLSVSPSTGECSTESDPITIHFQTAGLLMGPYTGYIFVTSPNATNSPQQVRVDLNITTVPPDFDGDGDVDMIDFGHLQRCFSGPGISQTDPACADARLDADDDVDQGDCQKFINCLSAPDVRADPYCVGL